MINEKDIKYDILKMTADMRGEKPSALRMHKPVIDMKKCDKTYRCVAFCPQDAIEMRKDEYPSINHDKCDGCLICLRECPTTAIEEVVE